MKKFVVSLESRQERRRWFDDTNHRKIEYEFFSAVDGSRLDYHYLCQNGYDTNKNWIDPIHNTHITSGEVGCFISHYILWKKCIELIFIWEFSSAVSPTSVGGSAVAFFVLAQEKLSTAKTATIVLYTVVLDTIFFVGTLPILFAFFGTKTNSTRIVFYSSPPPCAKQQNCLIQKNQPTLLQMN